MQSSSDPRIIEPVELRVEGVSKSFGAFRALHDVNVTARLGQVTALVGPNGAGKTTLFHVIGGNLTPDSGRVFLNGADVTGLPPYKIARRHVGRLFQDVRVFPPSPLPRTLKLRSCTVATTRSRRRSRGGGRRRGRRIAANAQ